MDAAQAVELALAAITGGELVVICCTEANEDCSECCLALAAQQANEKQLAYVIRHSTGVVRAALEKGRLESLGIHPMEDNNRLYVSTDFANVPAGGGASARGRAMTLKALCEMSHSSSSFSKTGNISPVAVAQDGVLERRAIPEAVCDLCRLSRLEAVGAFAEIMNEDGTLLAHDQAVQFSKQHKIPLVTIDQIREYRTQREISREPGRARGIMLETECQMWCDDIEAVCSIKAYSTANPKIEIVALVKGEVSGVDGVPARVHSECFTGDILGSKRCDCGQQLHKFMRTMNTESCGVLLYIRGHEGRGIGLPNKFRAYKLQDEGFDTVEANLKLGLPVDTRNYQDALKVFQHLNVKSLRLFTNNPEKMQALKHITQEVCAIASVPCAYNATYLRTKQERLNHRTVLETFKLPKTRIDKKKTRIGVVYTSWNSFFVNELLKVAIRQLDNAGVRHCRIPVPGATELVSGSRFLIKKGKVDAVLVLGVLIRGSSDVYDVTCNAVMNGLMELNASQDVPVITGLLMCRDEDQATERSHGSNNPAKAWAETAIHMSAIYHAEDLNDMDGECLSDLLQRQDTPSVEDEEVPPPPPPYNPAVARPA